METTDLTPNECMRFEENRLALESLNNQELSFVFEMAHLLRDLHNGNGITINNYAVNTDKFIIVMEQNNNLKSAEIQ